MNVANQCPKCLKYIIGEYCFDCKLLVTEYHDMPDFFKDILKEPKGDK